MNVQSVHTFFLSQKVSLEKVTSGIVAKREKFIPKDTPGPKANPQNLKQFTVYTEVNASIKKQIDLDRSDKIQR